MAKGKKEGKPRRNRVNLAKTLKRIQHTSEILARFKNIEEHETH